MDERIDQLKEQGDSTKKAMDSNRTKLDGKGFKQAKYDLYTAAQTNLNTKDSAQVKSVEAAEAKTNEKNQTRAEAERLIDKTNLTVKSTYGENKAKLKLFKVDETITGGYNGIIDRCEYLGGTCEANQTDLTDNGMTAEEIASLKSMPDRLREASSDQKQAKKEQKAATELRDNAAKVFKSEIKKITNFVKANFADDPEMLIAFEPIPKGGGGRGGNGGTDTPPEPPSNPPA